MLPALSSWLADFLSPLRWADSFRTFGAPCTSIRSRTS